MFRTPRRLLVLTCLLSTLLAGGADAQNQNQAQSPAGLWADFNHYVLIARPELAAAAGQRLLEQADNPQLLQVVEQSDYENFQQNLQRAKRIDQVREVAIELEQRIQQARIDQARDPQRIAADIDLLDEGQRPYRNAVQRLRAAGQYAAPHLLEALLDENNRALHPYVMTAMVDVGEPMSYPLAVALPQLDAGAQAVVAQVLAEIGYPLPLPYLKAMLESDKPSPEVRAVLQRAYQTLAANAQITGEVSAAELFLRLGLSQYQRATQDPTDFINYDPSHSAGLVWTYGPRIGLVPVPVPGAIYGDVLAMRNARNALQLDAALDQALSLYLASNLRRENRLPEGASDPSYPAEAEEASYYAMLAGPPRMHDVLATALADQDPALALDAIRVLAQTAGTEALINQGHATQPLLEALSYPSRRVRFRAAQAMANALPQQAFEGSYRVVPVLAEAVGQTGDRTALVLAENQDQLNELIAAMQDLGFTAFGATSLDGVSGQLDQVPGIDLAVVSQSAQQVLDFYARTENDYKLGAAPILALVPGTSVPMLEERARVWPRVRVSARTTQPEQLRAAVEGATASAGGAPIEGDEAADFARTALNLLRQIALHSEVFNVADAQPSLIAALEDDREQIVELASQVLALINNPQAQQAVASAALGARGSQQITLLNSLAESARYHGNMLTEQQVNQVAQLVEQSTGETALAAAQAHGALSLPTSKAVTVIIR